jgi:hypothetical protein
MAMPPQEPPADDPEPRIEYLRGSESFEYIIATFDFDVDAMFGTDFESIYGPKTVVTRF